MPISKGFSSSFPGHAAQACSAEVLSGQVTCLLHQARNVMGQFGILWSFWKWKWAAVWVLSFCCNMLREEWLKRQRASFNMTPSPMQWLAAWQKHSIFQLFFHLLPFGKVKMLQHASAFLSATWRLRSHARLWGQLYNLQAHGVCLSRFTISGQWNIKSGEKLGTLGLWGHFATGARCWSLPSSLIIIEFPKIGVLLPMHMTLLYKDSACIACRFFQQWYAYLSWYFDLLANIMVKMNMKPLAEMTFKANQGVSSSTGLPRLKTQHLSIVYVNYRHLDKQNKESTQTKKMI